MIILFLVLIVFAGFCEGVMDKLQFHYHKSIFKKFKNTLFWNPEYSWRNKYKNGIPEEGERFRFSTTFLVSLTDGWHLFKLLRNIMLFVSLLCVGYFLENVLELLLFIILCRTLYGIGFWVSYYKILKD